MNRLKRKTPIIFIPGLMGSMGDDIIKGSGSWSFGMARWVYNPLIRGLESMGYVIKQNLFICYYDWRKNTEEIIPLYLLPLIRKVEEFYPGEKIDIICHSMGGIVARSYIQNNNYRFNINKLIMIGVPNKGAIAAYYFWSKGQVLLNKEKNNFMNLIYQGYIWILFKLMGISNDTKNLNTIHETFPAIKELIPSYDYGEFLYYRAHDGEWLTLPENLSLYSNDLLNKLNGKLPLALEDSQEIYNIMGYNQITPEYLIINGQDYHYNLEEIIIDSIWNLGGDGVVTVKSAELGEGHTYYLEAGHRGLLAQSVNYIKDIYKVDVLDLHEDIPTDEPITLHILFRGNFNFTVFNNQEKILLFTNGQIESDFQVLHEKFQKVYNWIIIDQLPKGRYFINFENYKLDSLDILILSEGLREFRGRKELSVHRRNFTYGFIIA